MPLAVLSSDYNPTVGGLGTGQSFGQSDDANFGSFEQAIHVCGSNHFGTSRIAQPTAGGFGSSGFSGPNGTTPGLFANPSAVYNCFRNPILGLDGNGGAGTLRGQPFWNVDLQIKKNVRLAERYSLEFQTIFTNVFNHVQLTDPFLQLTDPGDWGALEGQLNTPRQMEFGLRLRF